MEFYSRYSILMSQQEADLSDKKETCKNVLQRVIQVGLLCRAVQQGRQQLAAGDAFLPLASPQDPDHYKFGRTKIFFRAGQVAYLEKLRLDRLRRACVSIQKRVRGWSQRRKFLRVRAAAVLLQEYVRGKRTIR